jgi:hypothetical protein
MQKSQIFPSTFSVEGAHSLKSILLCANIQVRGVYTSDNLYDYVTMPSDMRFKFAFDLSKWEEYFDFLQLPYHAMDSSKKSVMGASKSVMS